MFDVKEFARLVSGGYRFGGASKEEIAAHIRKFADAFERGDIFLQEVDAKQAVRIDDYYAKEVTFRFVEREAQPQDFSG